MNREKSVDIGASREEDYSVKSSRKNNIISYIICVFAAIIIWLLIMNLSEPVNIPLDANAGADADEMLMSMDADYE